MGISLACLKAAAAVIAWLAVAGCVPRLDVPKVERQEPAEIANRADLAPIQFGAMRFKLRRGTKIGTCEYTLLAKCFPFIEAVYWNQGRVKARDVEYADLFFEAMSNANFNVVGGQIEEIRMNVCDHVRIWAGLPIGAQSGTGYVKVKWQVFSLFDRIRLGVVRIDSETGHGSGFFVSPSLIMTNFHVVRGSSIVRVVLVTGRKIPGEVIRRHDKRDVALIQVESGGHQPLPMRLEPLKITEEVFAVGTPLDKAFSGTVTKGIVSRLRTNKYGLEDIQADVDIQGCNSGGALLDANGNLVGVTYAGIGESSIGMNFFIPIYDALNKLNIEFKPKRAASDS